MMATKKKAGIEVKTSGKTVDSEKSKLAVEAMKKKAQETKAEVAANRKKAEEKKKESGGSDAADLIGSIAKSGKSSKLKTIIIVGVVVLALVAGGGSLSGLLNLGSLFGSGEKDDVMGYTTIDFQQAVLGEAREKQELVVLEQDVKVDTEISSAMANIELFKKTKMIHTFGTGVYTVDMSKITEGKVMVDEAARTVTIIIPHTVLQYINTDPTKTEFEETEQLIPIGDLKLTAEQTNVVDQAIEEAMREQLASPEQMAKADEVALLKVAEVYQPIVSAVSNEFLVIAAFEE